MSKNSHITVVDDEVAAREMVGDYLKMHGFTAKLCDGGASLRRELKCATPDLIVLDLNMPEEDGLSVIRDIKRQSGVPVIMLAGTASTVDRVVGLEIGADDYVAKPCELRELVARVPCCAGALRRRRPRRSPETAGFVSAPSGLTCTPTTSAMMQTPFIISPPRSSSF